MVRIADGIGIPLDGVMHMLSGDMRADLGIDRYGSAANTPESGVAKRALGRVLYPVAIRAMKLILPRVLGRRSRQQTR